MKGREMIKFSLACDWNDDIYFYYLDHNVDNEVFDAIKYINITYSVVLES